MSAKGASTKRKFSNPVERPCVKKANITVPEQLESIDQRLKKAWTTFAIKDYDLAKELCDTIYNNHQKEKFEYVIKIDAATLAKSYLLLGLLYWNNYLRSKDISSLTEAKSCFECFAKIYKAKGLIDGKYVYPEQFELYSSTYKFANKALEDIVVQAKPEATQEIKEEKTKIESQEEVVPPGLSSAEANRFLALGASELGSPQPTMDQRIFAELIAKSSPIFSFAPQQLAAAPSQSHSDSHSARGDSLAFTELDSPELTF